MNLEILVVNIQVSSPSALMIKCINQACKRAALPVFDKTGPTPEREIRAGLNKDWL